MSQQIKLCIIYIVWIYWLIIKLNKDLRKMKQYIQSKWECDKNFQESLKNYTILSKTR